MLSQIRSILFRSFILAIIFLFIAYNVYALFDDFILFSIRQFFSISGAEARRVLFNGYCGVKVVAVWLFLVPALAISWYQFDEKRRKKSAKKQAS